MTAAEDEILKALAVGDRAAARVLLGRRIRDRELPAPTGNDTERH